MKKILQISIMCLVGVFLFSEKSGAYSPYQVFKKNRIDFNLTTNLFKTQANFIADGSQQNLNGSNYFQNIEVTPSVRWELFEDMGFIGGLNISSAESSDPLTTRKNSIANRIDVGADYLFWNSDIHETFFRFIYSQPLEKNNLNTDSVSTSDGAIEMKPEVIVRFNFDGFYPYFQGGLNYRSEGLSMLATYAAGAEVRFSEIGLGAAVLGRASVKDDNYSNLASTRDTVNNSVNAGSKKYFAVNPNSTDIELNLNFSANENLLFKFFGGYTMLGSNSAIGYNAGVSINFNFGGYSKYQSLQKKKIKQQPAEKLNTISREPTPTDFKEDTNDGVNQDYFKPVAPVAPAQKNYINQVDGSAQNLDNATAIESSDSKTQDINGAEDYQIKLKKKKKK